MKYTIGTKTVNISDLEIAEYMAKYTLTQEQAINLWLEDNDLLDNEELNALDEKAKKVKIDHGASAVDKTVKKESKPREIKVSDDKKTVFNAVLCSLTEQFGENVQILKENKLIEVKIGENIIKIDIIEQRKPKLAKKI